MKKRCNVQQAMPYFDESKKILQKLKSGIPVHVVKAHRGLREHAVAPT